MILLTGSAGYIGSHISHILDKKNIKYLGIDNLSKSTNINITNEDNFLKGDYGSAKLIKKIFLKYKIHTVIHCGAYAYVIDGEKNKKDYLNNNYKKSKTFFEICKYNKIQNFIFLSSSNIYKDSDGNNFFPYVSVPVIESVTIEEPSNKPTVKSNNSFEV